MLSESVSNALMLTGGSSVEGTANFVEMMDKWFDCLNVHNFSHGVHARKPFQMPYGNGKDKRLTVRGNKLYTHSCSFYLTRCHYFAVVA